MKNKKFKKIFSTTMMCALLVGAMAATSSCEDEGFTINLSIEENVESVNAGEYYQLTGIVSDKEMGLPSYEIIEGSEYATISAAGLLFVEEDVPNDTTIKVNAKIGDTISNVITLTAKTITLTSISINVDNNVENLERGQDIMIKPTLNPAKPTNKTITYLITEGSEFASIDSTGKLTIETTAATGSRVKVKASQGTIDSNILTFNIIETLNSAFDVEASTSAVTLDAKGTNSTYALTANAYTPDDKKMKNAQFEYSVFSGSDYVSVSSTGVISVIGHGNAVVRVKLNGESAYTDVNVKAILPPDTINIAQQYTFAKTFGFGYLANDATTKEQLNFGVIGTTVSNNTPSNTYSYKFFYNGIEDSTLGQADGNNITFNANSCGKEVMVKITSTSGSAQEQSINYKVNVNDGTNIHSKAEYINYVETNKGFNLLSNISIEKSDYDLITGYDNNGKTDRERYLAVINGYNKEFYGDVTIHGNGYTISVSNEFTVEYHEGVDSSLIRVYNYNNDDNKTSRTTTNNVNIYDLDISGAAGLEGDFKDQKDYGTTGFYSGIRIDGADRNTIVRYLNGEETQAPMKTKLYMSNVNVQGYQFGMYIRNVVNSTITDSFVGNCFEEGMLIVSSILTLNNMRIGAAGTTSIEVAPDMWFYAGINSDKAQEITFTGTLSIDNKTNFTTKFVLGSPEPLYGQLGTILNTLISTYNSVINKNINYVKNVNDIIKDDGVNLGILQFNSLSDDVAHCKDVSKNENNNQSVIHFNVNGIQNNYGDVSIPTTNFTYEYAKMPLDLTSMDMGNLGFAYIEMPTESE